MIPVLLGAALACAQPGIEAALKHLNSATEADGSVRGRNMKPFSGLAGGETSVKTQIDDLTIGFGKQNDHFPK